jgi:hypothetical protein
MRLSSLQRIVLTTSTTVVVFVVLMLFKPVGPQFGPPPGGGIRPGMTQTGRR